MQPSDPSGEERHRPTRHDDGDGPIGESERARVVRLIKSRVRVTDDATRRQRVAEIVASNKRTAFRSTASERAPYFRAPRASGEQASASGAHRHGRRVQTALSERVQSRQRQKACKVRVLREVYRRLNKSWRCHCERMNVLASQSGGDTIHRRPNVSGSAHMLGSSSSGAVADANTVSSGATFGSSGNAIATGAAAVHTPSFDEPMLASSLTRANRRNTQSGGLMGFGDAVRSEAEFLEILASLENADMQDPSMRAARTTAVEPDMTLDENDGGVGENRKFVKKERTFDDDNGYVADPISFYLSDFDPDVWTHEEKAIFSRRYALFPKQFGKIAAALPGKSTSQCVSYYYLSKKTNDFKSLLVSRNRDRRRKAKLVKPKKGRGSALMADLKAATTTTTLDDGFVQDDEQTPPEPGTPIGGQPSSRRAARTVVRAADRRALPATAAASTSARPTAESVSAPIVASPPSPPASSSHSTTAMIVIDESGKQQRNASRHSTSSYWSIAERTEFLRSLAIIGRDWEKIAHALPAKSAAQARNYYVRNAEEADFVEAVQLARSNADLTEGARREAADALIRRRAIAAPLSHDDSATESAQQQRGRLNISALLNTESDGGSAARRASLHDWFGQDRDGESFHAAPPFSRAPRIDDSSSDVQRYANDQSSTHNNSHAQHFQRTSDVYIQPSPYEPRLRGHEYDQRDAHHHTLHDRPPPPPLESSDHHPPLPPSHSPYSHSRYSDRYYGLPPGRHAPS